MSGYQRLVFLLAFTAVFASMTIRIAEGSRRSQRRHGSALSKPTAPLADTKPAFGKLPDLGSVSGPAVVLAPASGPDIQSAAAGDVLHIAVGRSVVLTSAAPLRRLYVGNPAVIQSYTSGQQEVVLTAKTVGVSSIVLWDTTGGHRLYTLSADFDPAALSAALADAFPNSPIQVGTSGGKVVLSGTVISSDAADAALKLASLYSKEVVSSLRVEVPRAKQVQLKLRIVEVDRTRLEQLGINFFAGGKNTSTTTTQQFGTTAITPNPTGGGTFSLNPLNLLFFNSSLNVGVNVQDLEQKQILQILAEPTLTTISGQTARFLSGGEFPVPIVQGGTANSTALSIIFKPYGIKVEFTPTVGADGSIRLKVAPEVSTLDYANGVTISGFAIPALATRRAETEVEIKDGQSFIVSGLLDHRVTDSVNKVPGFSEIPLVGQVFRSKSFQHSVIELVVLVTASIVDPLTDTAVPVTPKLAVPSMDGGKFDLDMNKDWKTGDPTKPKAEHE
jgi:pilus assembly protein CpaC